MRTSDLSQGNSTASIQLPVSDENVSKFKGLGGREQQARLPLDGKENKKLCKPCVTRLKLKQFRYPNYYLNRSFLLKLTLRPTGRFKPTTFFPWWLRSFFKYLNTGTILGNKSFLSFVLLQNKLLIMSLRVCSRQAFHTVPEHAFKNSIVGHM